MPVLSWADLQVREPETVKTANYLIDRLSRATVTAELLHPDELVSGMISQVAASPELADLLSGFIYQHAGKPFCLRPHPSQSLSSREVQEGVREARRIRQGLIGVRVMKETPGNL